MMLHDKMMPGQILLDMRNECSANKMDIYNAYNFHHHQQQQQMQQQRLESQVLDLSRRCDSVETRKTPSPYNSTSSFGTASPSTNCGSPQNLSQASSAPSVPAPLRQNPIPLPQGIASLYPLYYQNIKQENTSPPPAPVMPTPLPFFQHNPAALLQQTFNSHQSSTAYSSPKSEDQQSRSPPSDAGSILYPNILNAATTGTVSAGKTRPFNAYPRDPLLVAAHFAASDVLFDKTTMERYSTYRKRALDDLQSTNGGHRIVTNPKMRRTNHRNGPNSESEERAMESSDNDSSSTDNNKNDSNNNDSANCGGIKDEAYFERRRKNNAAAKKSRDRRRIKEDEIAIRAAYLERQNIELLCQVEALKKQLEAYTKA